MSRLLKNDIKIIKYCYYKFLTVFSTSYLAVGKVENLVGTYTQFLLRSIPKIVI